VLGIEHWGATAAEAKNAGVVAPSRKLIRHRAAVDLHPSMPDQPISSVKTYGQDRIRAKARIASIK
jgi:hypothetical protein